MEINSELIAAIDAQSASTWDIALNSTQAEERTSQVRAGTPRSTAVPPRPPARPRRACSYPNYKSLVGDSSARTKVDRFLATVCAV